jgi:hypothetical protein
LRQPDLLRFCVVLSLSLAAVAAVSRSPGRNLAPDAVSRATTWNEHEGDVAWLTDGITPPADGAFAFQWNTKGILVFVWDSVQPVDRVRIRVGAIANDYQVRTYVGGHLQHEGATRDPEGELTARVDDRSRVVDGWQEILLPSATTADNLELPPLGPVQLFEVEILTTESTAVESIPWAVAKAAHRHR